MITDAASALLGIRALYDTFVGFGCTEDEDILNDREYENIPGTTLSYFYQLHFMLSKRDWGSFYLN